MKAIVVMDLNGAIGKQNKLLAYMPKDLEMFKEETKGHVVLMGRKTLESLPGGKPLKGRVNVVLTSDRNFEAEGVQVVHSIAEALTTVRALEKEYYCDTYVIGGASIYEQFLPYCQTVIISIIDHSFDDTDAFFPKKEPGVWSLVSPPLFIKDTFNFTRLVYAK